MTKETMSHRTRRLGTSAALLIPFALAGCGGGGDADVVANAADKPPTAASVPDSAFASSEASIAYQRTLTASDRAEPLEIGNLTPPTDDRAEPVEIG